MKRDTFHNFTFVTALILLVLVIHSLGNAKINLSDKIIISPALFRTRNFSPSLPEVFASPADVCPDYRAQNIFRFPFVSPPIYILHIYVSYTRVWMRACETSTAR